MSGPVPPFRKAARLFLACAWATLLRSTSGDPKITGIIFLNWFIRFYTITTLVSFKVLSFSLDTLVPTFYPLLKTFLELFSVLMLFKTSSVFFFSLR